MRVYVADETAVYKLNWANCPSKKIYTSLKWKIRGDTMKDCMEKTNKVRTEMLYLHNN